MTLAAWERGLASPLTAMCQAGGGGGGAMPGLAPPTRFEQQGEPLGLGGRLAGRINATLRGETELPTTTDAKFWGLTPGKR